MRLSQQLMVAAAILVHTSLDGVAGDVVTVDRGDNITLACVNLTDGEQLESLFWYREDVLLASVGSNKGVTLMDSLGDRRAVENDDVYSLTLWDLAVADTAAYSCKVFVLNITQLQNYSVQYELIVQDVPSPPGQAVAESIESREATIRWAASSTNNNSPITNYIVQIRGCDSPTAEHEVETGAQWSEGREVEGLEPDSCYVAQVLAQNSMGTSRPGPESDPFHTSAEVPTGAPQDFRAVSTSSSDIHLTWRPPRPDMLNGQLQGYKVMFYIHEEDVHTVPVQDPDTTELTLHGLRPYMWYTVSVLAFNSQGHGPKAEKAVQTLQGVPSPPRITHITVREATSFFVHWEPPKVVNGQLKSYELRWTLDGESKKRIISGLLTNPMSAFITGLKAWYEKKMIQTQTKRN